MISARRVFAVTEAGLVVDVLFWIGVFALTWSIGHETLVNTGQQTERRRDFVEERGAGDHDVVPILDDLVRSAGFGLRSTSVVSISLVRTPPLRVNVPTVDSS
jgi:hypothetical protein